MHVFFGACGCFSMVQRETKRTTEAIFWVQKEEPEKWHWVFLLVLGGNEGMNAGSFQRKPQVMAYRDHSLIPY